MPRVVRSIVESVDMGETDHKNDQRPKQGSQNDADYRVGTLFCSGNRSGFRIKSDWSLHRSSP